MPASLKRTYKEAIDMNSAVHGNKQIFISDIHMGDERSMNPSGQHPHPYCWLQSNIANLAKFLKEKSLAQDVGRVAILGDLFDQWVIPTDLDPLTKLDAIRNNPANGGIIQNLKELADSRKLVYVPGNHDMSASPKDIPDTKAFINATFPGIDFICEDERPFGVYRPDKLKLAAEHGNMYCLFNAPDAWTDPHSCLPLGYFISRLVAYKVSHTGRPENYLDILRRFIDEFKLRDDFIYDLLIAVAEDAGLDESAELKMADISGFPPAIRIDEVASKYMGLMRDWDNDRIDAAVAVDGDLAGLQAAAYRVYLGPGTDPDINIVIFGHTHAWKDEDPYPFLGGSDQEDGPALPSRPCKAIYANSGTWIDSKPCTYVETEADEESQRHYVRVKSYPGNRLLQELFVTL